MLQDIPYLREQYFYQNNWAQKIIQENIISIFEWLREFYARVKNMIKIEYQKYIDIAKPIFKLQENIKVAYLKMLQAVLSSSIFDEYLEQDTEYENMLEKFVTTLKYALKYMESASIKQVMNVIEANQTLCDIVFQQEDYWEILDQVADESFISQVQEHRNYICNENYNVQYTDADYDYYL